MKEVRCQVASGCVQPPHLLDLQETTLTSHSHIHVLIRVWPTQGGISWAFIQAMGWAPLLCFSIIWDHPSQKNNSRQLIIIYIAKYFINRIFFFGSVRKRTSVRLCDLGQFCYLVSSHVKQGWQIMSTFQRRQMTTKKPEGPIGFILPVDCLLHFIVMDSSYHH